MRELFRQKQRAKLWHDYGPTLAAEELAEDHGIRVNRETLRQWLMEAKLWRARRSRIERAHLWRPRRARYGELVQRDSSEHNWLEGRGEKLYLISRPGHNGAPSSKAVTLATALSSPLILSDMQHSVRARIEECAKTAGYRIANLVAETNSLTVIKNAVLDGMGLTILPISAVMSELERESLLAQEIIDPSVSCTVSVCWPRSIATNHAALCVARLIVAAATDIRATGRWPGAQPAHDQT